MGWGHGALTPPRPASASCATPAMATAHVHACRRRHFSAYGDGLLVHLAAEASGRRLVRLSELLEDLLVELQAQQPAPPADPELVALLPF